MTASTFSTDPTESQDSQYSLGVDVEAADLDQATQLGLWLSIAYEANPLVRWMFEDDLSQDRLQGLFTSLVEFGIKNGLVFAPSGGGGASIWFPPISEPMDQLDITTDTSHWSGGRRDAALAVLAGSRPSVPHFYLDAVGVLPDLRGRGTASCLLAPVLATCDSDGIGAYLENSDPANSSFYHRHGFEDTGALFMPEGAPPVVSMWRKPR
jgi:GNAT superfamily N-acetyltransferase